MVNAVRYPQGLPTLAHLSRKLSVVTLVALAILVWAPLVFPIFVGGLLALTASYIAVKTLRSVPLHRRIPTSSNRSPLSFMPLASSLETRFPPPIQPSPHPDARLVLPLRVLAPPEDLLPIDYRAIPIPFVIPNDIPLFEPRKDAESCPFTFLPQDIFRKITEGISTETLLTWRTKSGLGRFVNAELTDLRNDLAKSLGLRTNAQWDSLPMMQHLQDLIKMLHQEAQQFACDQTVPPELCKPPKNPKSNIIIDFKKSGEDFRSFGEDLKTLLKHVKEAAELETPEVKKTRLLARMAWEIDHARPIAHVLMHSPQRHRARQERYLSLFAMKGSPAPIEIPESSVITQLSDDEIDILCQRVQACLGATDLCEEDMYAYCFQKKKVLTIQGQPLRYLPNTDYSHLREIRVYETPLHDLPMLNSVPLVSALFFKTRFSTVPSPLLSCHLLESLTINESLRGFPEFPKETFPHLRFLNLNRNQLTEIPVSFTHLGSLRILALNENRFQEVPPHLGSLPNLGLLLLQLNPIRHRPSLSWTNAVVILISACELRPEHLYIETIPNGPIIHSLD